MTFPFKKTINTELFVGGAGALLKCREQYEKLAINLRRHLWLSSGHLLFVETGKLLS